MGEFDLRSIGAGAFLLSFALLALVAIFGMIAIRSMQVREPQLWERIGRPRLASLGRKVPWGYWRFILLDSLRGVDRCVPRQTIVLRWLTIGSIVAMVSGWSLTIAAFQ